MEDVSFSDSGESVIGPLLLLAGLLVLVMAAELVVFGATRVAAVLGVRPILLGITVVAVGTSAPELAVGITANLQGSGSLAVGNIAGTNMVNLLFILGLSAMLSPLHLHMQILKLELPVIVLASTLMFLLSLNGVLSRLDGGLMVVCGIVYTVVLIRKSQNESPEVKQEFGQVYGEEALFGGRLVVRTQRGFIVCLLLGVGLSLLGADWLVEGAVAIARSLGVSEAVIGLTIVAIGTSAPELVTTIVSTLRGNREVAIGNLLGSSIYNILAILGITCLASPAGVVMDPVLVRVDIPLMLAVALACIPVFVSGRRISRGEGAFAVLLYLAYLGWLVFGRASSA